MAWCDLCKQDDGYHAKPGDAIPDSCVPNEIPIDDSLTFMAIPYGSDVEGWKQSHIEPSERCHDCRVKIGGFHHPGCDVERCPVCVATNGWGQFSEAWRMRQRGDAVQAMLCGHCETRKAIR